MPECDSEHQGLSDLFRVSCVLLPFKFCIRFVIRNSVPESLDQRKKTYESVVMNSRRTTDSDWEPRNLKHIPYQDVALRKFSPETPSIHSIRKLSIYRNGILSPPYPPKLSYK